jgi:cytochrome c
MLIFLLVPVFLVMVDCSRTLKETRVLVFSKTTVYRHESIPAGIALIRKLGEQHNFLVDTTENAAAFHEENLKRYNAVIFLNTTGDVLNAEQQNNFERYIQAGGGFVGIHSATDTEYDWPWYGKLAGAYFTSHPNNPNVLPGAYDVIDHAHPSTDSLPDRWERTDEFYNFRDINPDLKVLITLDEKSYTGGTNGDFHPASWYHEYDGGRAFYTAMGHTSETYTEPLFIAHLWGGLEWVLGEGRDLNYSKVSTPRMPAENRFTKVVLDEKLEEPVELAVLPGDRVLFIERRGNVKIYDPKEGKTKVITKIPVSTKYINPDGNQPEAEDGLLGVALDPNFKSNHWVYFYYSPADDEPKNILARYELKNDELVESSKKVILEVPTQRQECCHTGGSITFDAQGNLYLSTGDNTSPRSTAYAPIDERPGRSPWDAQKSSANTNDLRGKILRIHPEPDGTYTIPEGNLFPKGTEKTRPEIYVMGNRNPYRISVDQHTGYLYWGDVGPDAGSDSANLGPKAYDEIGQARKAGNFGWPHFVGDNQAYYEYDFATGKSTGPFDPAKPINNSPNNTGLTELPPAQKAFIWYPYDRSKEFPLVGTGGRTAMAGPVYYLEDYKKAPRHFPEYYDKKLFIYEWMRGWIMAVTMNEQGDYVSMEPFMPGHRFSNPMDMEFSSESGDLYMLEYGTAWFRPNDDARLIRIEYTEGNRKPVVEASADKTRDAVPMTVNLSAAGTHDYDHDELSYQWSIVDAAGKSVFTSAEQNLTFTFDKVGVYKATLKVTDSKGASAERDLDLYAGNQPPRLSFELSGGNQTFFLPGVPFTYEVKVQDKEDGSLADGTIATEQVSVTFDYLPEGFDQIHIAQGHQQADASAAMATGQKIMDGSDCKACHFLDQKSIGPNFREIAARYKDDPKAVDYLADKIIKGGGGVWGETAMAAHPQLAKSDVVEIVKYILSLNQVAETKRYPTKGTYVPEAGASPTGVYVIRAAYTDKGANGMPAAMAEQTFVLRNPTLIAGSAEMEADMQRFSLSQGPTFMIGTKAGAYVGFRKIDLKGVKAIAFGAGASSNYGFAGGIIEVRKGSPDGELLGSTPFIKPTVAQAGGSRDLKPTLAPIKPSEGINDLYFVFREGGAVQPGQPLVVLITATMVSK